MTECDGGRREVSSMRALGRGFTLIELMAVIVIMGLLVGIVVPNLWGLLQKSTRDAAQAQMKSIADAVQLYSLQERSLPSSLEDLTLESKKLGQPYMAHIPKDPWKQEYDYKVVSRAKQEFLIPSSGQDRAWGTEDDLACPVKPSGD